MTPTEFREILKRLGLSYARAAEVLHVHVRTISLWATHNGIHQASPMARVILRAMGEGHLTADEVKRMAE